VLLGEIGFVWLDTLVLGGIEVPRAMLAMAVMLMLDAAFVLAFYKALKLATFDPDLARALGLAPGLIFYVHLSLLSGTAVAAFDAVGVVLFITFVVVPPATAYLLTRRLPSMILLAMALATGPFLLLAYAWRRWRAGRQKRSTQPVQSPSASA
jgi:manganese/zinc/iron transport system permease protein